MIQKGHEGCAGPRQRGVSQPGAPRRSPGPGAGFHRGVRPVRAAPGGPARRGLSPGGRADTPVGGPGPGGGVCALPGEPPSVPAAAVGAPP